MSKAEMKTTEFVYHKPSKDGQKNEFVTLEIYDLDGLESLGVYIIKKSDYYRRRQNNPSQSPKQE